MASTTIKVPVELRDRLAAIAEREHTTMAGAISRSLDAAEELSFWAAVALTLAAPNGPEQRHASAESFRGDLTDGLDPEESWGDVW